MENIKGKIVNFVGKYVEITKLDEDTDLFTEGYVNSLFAMQLIMFLEKEFDLTISNEDLHIKNFKSIKMITSYILSKNTSGEDKV